MKKSIMGKRLFMYFVATLFLALFSFGIYSLVTALISLGEGNGWDGYTIATDFSKGNGTKENPYLIENAEEFMYFKELIEGDSFSAYQDKYYALISDIDFNGNVIVPIGVVKGEEERFFSGHLDGNGHALTNFKIKSPVTIENVDYYSLFTKVKQASFYSLEVTNYRVQVEDDDHIKIVSSFVGEYVGEEIPVKEEEKVSEDEYKLKNITVVEEKKESEKVEEKVSPIFKNVSITDFYVDASNIKDNEHTVVSSFIGKVNGKAVIKNIFLKGEVNGTDEIKKVYLALNPEENVGNVYNIITSVRVLNMKENALSYTGLENIYVYQDGKFYFREEEVERESILAFLNDDIDEKYYWEIENEKLMIFEYQEANTDIPNTSKSFNFTVRNSPDIALHDTGLDGNTVYLNDLDADYNYYMGLNYTQSNNGSIPSGNNQNLYTSSNLAKVYIAYKGNEINNTSITGKLSNTENYTDFVYYKYYPIVNGKVKIPLIDNPYASRPAGRAFNGWITDYEGAVISYDSDIYARYVTIPVEGTGPFSVTMYASWTVSTVVTASVSNNGYLNTSNLNSIGMQSIAYTTPVFDTNVPNLYTRSTISSGTNRQGVPYPSGAVNQNGNSLAGSSCTPSGNWLTGYTAVTCTFYLPIPLQDAIPGTTYYYLRTNGGGNNASMQTYVMPSPIDYQYTSILPIGTSMSGFYLRKALPNGASYAGLYDSHGKYQSTGTCGNNCVFYELVQYDPDVVLSTGDTQYYYLVTRDTNIALVSSSIDGFTNEKPVTVTGLNGSNNYSTNTIDLSERSINAGADLRIEHVQLYSTNYDTSTSGPTDNNYNYVYGNFYNLKIGRGQTTRTGTVSTGWGWGNTETVTYYNAKSVIAGNDGGASSTKRYHMIVESGYYNHTSGVGTTSVSASTNFYLEGYSTFGCDFDRARVINSNLTVYYTSSSTWGGAIRSANNTTNFMTTTIKSGTFGQATSESASGVYVGGLSGGTIYAPASLTVEGGKILYLNGGPLVDSSFSSTNAIYINFKGGTVDNIFGGAARSLTHGNRIINVSGGTVNYAVYGGSNGYNGNDSSDTNRGTLNGSTFVYVGGSATIGGGTNAQFGVETGSVFGAGNGNATYSSIGAVNNSTVVIGLDATVNANVYGGGNYGAVNARSGNSSATKINVGGGEIKGSVYGGGNNNGSGSTSVTSTINITVSGGDVKGSVYGGSRTAGIIYGATNVNISGGTVDKDVYGGGEGGYRRVNNTTYPGTYVRDNVAVTVNSGTVKGNVYGGSAYGSVNSTSQNSSTSNTTTTVTVNGGTVTGSVFGGAKGDSTYTPRVMGGITVTVNGGSIGKVFGGFDAAGSPNAGDVVYLKGGTIGSAFGGGNNTGQTATDIRLQGSTITGNLYGGSNVSGTVPTTNVTVSSGSVADIYGGNNLGGSATTTNVTVTSVSISGDIYGGGNEAPSTTSNVLINGASVNDVYGGGKQAGLTTSNVTLTGATADDVFGGSNVSGNVATSNVHVASSTLTSAYGGNNQGGQTTLTNVDVTSSTITDVFGGGDNAVSGESNVIINSGNITNVYGGGNEAGLTTSHVTVLEGTIGNVYGGSNSSGNITTSYVVIGGEDEEPITLDIQYTKREPGYWPQSSKPTYAQMNITLTNNTDTNISDWEMELDIPSAEIFANNSGSNVTINGDTFYVNSVNRYYGYNTLTANGGTYQMPLEVLSDTPLDQFEITGEIVGQYAPHPAGGNIHIGNVYGGNNLGGTTTNTNISATGGTIGTVYGGGNEASVGTTSVVLSGITATDVYGGGNAAGVTGSTYLDIDDSTVNNNVYGGGNEGVVEGDTEVFLTDSHIKGNAFAGGNGSTAVVYRDSTITIDGDTEVGTDSSVAPNGGCVFGSGNAASTGRETTNNSHAKVNLVGGTIHGNVYGGPKMAVVYGVTDTNIGTAAVNNSNLVESDIVISGTVFGGGESNASGSTSYDWTFISVTRGITVNINGTNYIEHDHDFIINGSIFGSGNASSSAGTSEIYIKNLGSMALPNKSISIQRANYAEVDASVIELKGTTDRTNDYSDILYSINIVDKLVIKNNTTLLLHHNANLLKELYSGVDDGNGNLVPAEVLIDDDTKTVTKNVDNRIYMIPGQNLNVTINQAATAYGRITGMTFFGMYLSNASGYRYGLYSPTVNYGDTGDAGLEIVGGSYVVGLHHANHDITVDGFYSNYLTGTNMTDITTAYIDPTAIGETGYRWTIGFEAINYEFTLTASKYSSLGTTELQLSDFGQGDVIFNVLSVDTTALDASISFVDPSSVPRVGRTQQQANQIFGLAMKAETQEWTGYGTTKYYSQDTGVVIGDREYRTDSRKLPPSLMFYLYHAKNISISGNLGKAVITMQAAVPRNAIEYDIEYITITANIVARQFDDADSYDASITYDKRYEMPSSTLVNITNTSQFSTYFSLIAWNDNFNEVYGNGNRNFHVLVTNHPLPVGTMITMLDYGANDNRPEYYYFRVTQAVYDAGVAELETYHEVTYPLSGFIKMDSTSSGNHYSDPDSNLLYYDSDTGLVDEEFMFIFDFKDCTVTGDHEENTMLFELRTHENRTVFTVLGIREGLMVYNTYESSNVVLGQTLTDVSDYLYYNVPDDITYTTRIQYDETENRQSVIDTNYESSSMGLNIVFLDRNGEPVTSSLLLGTNFIIDRQQYFADGDGVFRIKLANKVSNLIRNAQLTVSKDLPPGEYTVRYTLFASSDGLHNSNQENSVTQEFNVTVVSADNSIKVETNDLYKLVDGDAAINSANSKVNTYTVTYLTQLTSPNFRVEVYKRDTTNASSSEFVSIPFNQLFTTTLSDATGNEKYISMDGSSTKNFDFQLQDTLVSGTYRIAFKLYANNQLIDEDYQYVIVYKNLE